MRNTRSVEDRLPSRILEACNPGRRAPAVTVLKIIHVYKDLAARWNTFSSYFGDEGLSTQLASR